MKSMEPRSFMVQWRNCRMIQDCLCSCVPKENVARELNENDGRYPCSLCIPVMPVNRKAGGTTMTPTQWTQVRTACRNIKYWLQLFLIVDLLRCHSQSDRVGYVMQLCANAMVMPFLMLSGHFGCQMLIRVCRCDRVGTVACCSDESLLVALHFATLLCPIAAALVNILESTGKAGSALHEVGCNRGAVFRWHGAGLKPELAWCPLCNTNLRGAQHGAAAVKMQCYNLSTEPQLWSTGAAEATRPAQQQAILENFAFYDCITSRIHREYRHMWIVRGFEICMWI